MCTWHERREWGNLRRKVKLFKVKNTSESLTREGGNWDLRVPEPLQSLALIGFTTTPALNPFPTSFTREVSSSRSREEDRKCSLFSWRDKSSDDRHPSEPRWHEFFHFPNVHPYPKVTSHHKPCRASFPRTRFCSRERARLRGWFPWREPASGGEYWWGFGGLVVSLCKTDNPQPSLRR